MAPTAKDREDFSRPDKIYSNLTYFPDDHPPPPPFDVTKIDPTKKIDYYCYPHLHDDELCWSCGWRVKDQYYSSYGSRIRILYTCNNTGIWEVGSRWLIRDEPNYPTMSGDFMTQEFLRSQPNLKVPLIKEMRRISEPEDKVVLTLMSRAQGATLESIWSTLDAKQKSNYGIQLGNAIKEWRQFTSPISQRVDGSPPSDRIIGGCLARVPDCISMGHTDDDWLSNLEAGIKDGIARKNRTNDAGFIEARFQEMKKNFPKSEPYVLTHGDLNLSNIIVKDDKIEAIIDWEYAAYMPWWAERTLLLGGHDARVGELNVPLWELDEKKWDRKTWEVEILDRVLPLREAWQLSRNYVEHKGLRGAWARPMFCDCKEWAGSFQDVDLGMPVEHKLIEYDAEEDRKMREMSIGDEWRLSRARFAALGL